VLYLGREFVVKNYNSVSMPSLKTQVSKIMDRVNHIYNIDNILLYRQTTLVYCFIILYYYYHIFDVIILPKTGVTASVTSYVIIIVIGVRE